MKNKIRMCWQKQQNQREVSQAKAMICEFNKMVKFFSMIQRLCGVMSGVQKQFPFTNSNNCSSYHNKIQHHFLQKHINFLAWFDDLNEQQQPVVDICFWAQQLNGCQQVAKVIFSESISYVGEQYHLDSWKRVKLQFWSPHILKCK